MSASDIEDPSRAIDPVQAGRVEHRGVGVAYEVFGEGEETVLLLPPWSIVDSRFWKAQVPYLARHFRVVTFDPRGNGRSDRPARAEEYAVTVDAEHTLAVLDEAGVEKCVMVSHCGNASLALLLTASHPERIAGAVFMSPALPLTPPLPERTGFSFESEFPEYEGWAKTNRHYWQRDFRGYLEFFFSRCFTEPHSTKQIEDCLGWGLETSADTLALTLDAPDLDDEYVHQLLRRIRCPLLVTQGDEDGLIPSDRGAAFADATGAELVELENVGHCPNARHPVLFNLLIRDFAERTFGRRHSNRSSRSIGSRRIPSPARSRPAASGSTRPAGCSPTSPATSRRSHTSTNSTSFRPGGGWTRSYWPTSWSFTTSCVTSPTTSGSATRPGSSTTTCTRTRS